MTSRQWDEMHNNDPIVLRRANKGRYCWTDEQWALIVAGIETVKGASFVVTEIDSFKSSTASQSSYVSPSFNVSANDIVLVVAAINQGVAPSTVADSASNSYTSLLTNNRSTVVDASLWKFAYSGAASGLTITVSYSPSTSERLIKVLRIQGGSSTTLPDTASAGGTAGVAKISANGLSVSPAPGSMTPSNADLVIAFAAWASSTAASASPTGYTNTGADLNETVRGFSLSTYYKVQSATGAENPGWTIGSKEWVAGQIAIKTGVSTLTQALNVTETTTPTLTKTVVKVLS